MSLIQCTECGKEFSDKAPACPNCGCPTESILNDIQSSTMSDQISKNEYDQEAKHVGLGINIKNVIGSATSSAATKYKENRELAKYLKKNGIITINDLDRTFQIKGAIASNGKCTSVVGGLLKSAMAISTMGMSIAAGKALGTGKTKVGTKDWYNFDDLVSYELLEDDSIVTSGGVGQALIGGALFGGVGAIAGGITGKRIQKKRVESLYIKVTLNTFDHPCLLIPLITKPLKKNTKEYQNAFN